MSEGALGAARRRRVAVRSSSDRWRSRAVAWAHLLPRGNMLRDASWVRRHRLTTRFALVQAGALGGLAVALHANGTDTLLAVLVPGLPAIAGALPELSRPTRTLSTVTSLMFASAVLVSLCGGVTEAHFHFFIMVGVVSLYQDWGAFGLCVVITVLHHAVMGIGAPSTVFASAAHQAHPVRWAAIHGGAVLAASVTHMIAWKLNEQQQLRDPLTQLPNRTSFNEALEERAFDDQPLSVMFVDVDHFKAVNDSGGHHVGDAALIHLASAMSAAVRTDDLVARLGGDEFAILLLADARTAMEVSDRLERALSAPVVIDGREWLISASIGLADAELVGTRDPEALLRAADQAMYVAKSSGRGHTVVHSPTIDRTASRRARLADDLAHAVRRDEMTLAYQPIVDGDSAHIHAVEALARWEHPVLGPVGPAEFIPLAEETGSIVPLGAWVLEQACRQVATWRQDEPHLSDLHLSVNLATQQLRAPELVEHVAIALTGSGLPHAALTLEVTETSVLTDLDLARRQLEALRALGITVAIDDFGTGYSSLSYLARLPADHVKIDRSFVANLLSKETAAFALVRCIVDMAKALDLEVIAEGVEKIEQQEILERLGCRWSQGYLHAAPMHPDDLPLFAQRRGTGDSFVQVPA